jgi:DNA-3-methyladenine glycosylase
MPRRFYLRPTMTVARDLLGLFLVRRVGRRMLVGRIVEVEGYLGRRDPASHTYRGRTRRNDVMFWNGGHLYVYFTYGMHFCSNVVTEAEGTGHAVLIRAVEPIAGIDVMIRNRARARSRTPIELRKLCSGPARLCQAFGIARNENGTDLCGREIWIAADPTSPKVRIGRSARIGIRHGTEHLWRLFIKDHVSLSVSPHSRKKNQSNKRSAE